jgi:hypothetical protein
MGRQSWSKNYATSTLLHGKRKHETRCKAEIYLYHLVPGKNPTNRNIVCRSPSRSYTGRKILRIKVCMVGRFQGPQWLVVWATGWMPLMVSTFNSARGTKMHLPTNGMVENVGGGNVTRPIRFSMRTKKIHFAANLIYMSLYQSVPGRNRINKK